MISFKEMRNNVESGANTGSELEDEGLITLRYAPVRQTLSEPFRHWRIKHLYCREASYDLIILVLPFSNARHTFGMTVVRKREESLTVSPAPASPSRTFSTVLGEVNSAETSTIRFSGQAFPALRKKGEVKLRADDEGLTDSLRL